MFVVPKLGQPGQWRVIADMLRGGQNSCIGADPVILPRITHIMDQMYEGGFLAIADASKFFWNFTTHPEDQPYLGILHPVSKELYTYWGLPMGSGNSPPLAGHYGLSLLRLMRERSHLFVREQTVGGRAYRK